MGIPQKSPVRILSKGDERLAVPQLIRIGVLMSGRKLYRYILGAYLEDSFVFFAGRTRRKTRAAKITAATDTPMILTFPVNARPN